MNWNDRWANHTRTLRFVEGEIALLNINLKGLFGTPTEVMEVGPHKCDNCGRYHDYVVKLADGALTTVDDVDLKKLPPPPEELTESEEETDECEA